MTRGVLKTSPYKNVDVEFFQLLELWSTHKDATAKIQLNTVTYTHIVHSQEKTHSQSFPDTECKRCKTLNM